MPDWVLCLARQDLSHSKSVYVGRCSCIVLMSITFNHHTKKGINFLLTNLWLCECCFSFRNCLKYFNKLYKGSKLLALIATSTRILLGDGEQGRVATSTTTDLPVLTFKVFFRWKTRHLWAHTLSFITQTGSHAWLYFHNRDQPASPTATFYMYHTS